MKKRTRTPVAPAATSSTLVIAILLVAAAIAYALIRPSLQIEAPPTPTPTPASAAPAAGATGVGIIVYPEDDEQVLLDAIGHARKRVFMKMYLLSDYRVIDALAKALANGAQVRAMLEQHPFGGAGTTEEAMQKMKQAGIETKYTSPAFKLTHEKSFVIDDAAYILTANMTKSAFTRNREFGIIRTDPADVAEVAAAFQADWERTDFTPASPYLVWSPLNSRQRIDQVIDAATRTLEVYTEVAQDDEQIKLLVKAAQRGVNVRLITSPTSSSEDTSDSPSGLDILQSGGVNVRLVSSPYIHAKAFVADGALAFTGSENITASSLDFNRELGILLADANAIQRIQAAFEKDWGKGKDR